MLAGFLRKTGEHDAAHGWLTQAAEAGDIPAMLQIAHHFLGNGDVEAAEKWFLQLAPLRNSSSGENIKAMLELAIICEKRGQLAEARVWLRKASELGSFEALGDLLRIGPQVVLGSPA
jgi:TPR repeat protein